MKTTQLNWRVIWFVIGLLWAAPGAGAATGVGGLARDFTIVNHRTGQPIRLYDYAGSVVVLDFFAWWCGPCQASSPDVEENIQKYYQAVGGNASGIPVAVIGVNTESESPENTDTFIQNAGMELVGDDLTATAWDQFNVQNSIPLFVIINGYANSTTHRQWEVVLCRVGYSGADYLRSIIDSIQAANAIAPAITLQPEDQFVIVGAMMSLKVTAGGTAPLSYRWFKDGKAIDGANQERFEIAGVQASDAGVYTVEISNPAGSVTSNGARVRVFDDAPVVFPDPQLEAVVRSALKIESGPLLKTDLCQLTQLESSWGSISNLTGLEHAVRLRSLNLSGNPVRSIAPLGSLESLATLDLSYTAVASFEALTNAPQLAELTLSGANGETVRTVGLLAQLRKLSLSDLRIGSVPEFSQLTNLTDLRLKSGGLTNIDFIAGLGQLKYADLSSHRITDFTPVTRLPQLEVLLAGNNPVGDFSWVAKLRQMRALGLADTGLRDLGVLTNCPQLYYLDISGNPAGDFTPLSRLPGLTTLFVERLGLTSLSSFSELTGLYYLLVSDNRLTNLNDITPFLNLRELYADNNLLTDVSGATKLTKLQYVTLDGNRLDIQSDSAAMTDIKALTNRGVQVYYANQSFALRIARCWRSSDGWHVAIEAQKGRSLRLERSSDLVQWREVTTTTATSDALEMADTATPADSPGSFFRVLSY